MKYVNQLTDDELKALYMLFTDKGAKIHSLNIVKDEVSIALEGFVEIPEWDEEYLRDNPQATIIIDDDYELDDYDVKVYHHSGDVTKEYRQYMYEKFGDAYAKDYLFRGYEGEES